MNSMLAAMIAVNNARKNHRNDNQRYEVNNVKCDISEEKIVNVNKSSQQFKKILFYIILFIDIIVLIIFSLNCH